MPSPRFTVETFAFLGELARHNRREWFETHRTEYDTHVKGRMIGVIDRLAADLPRFAPELTASAKVSMYRIHRDTRFSSDKSPYKTQIAAIFPHRALSKHAGASLYFHVSADHVLVAAGIYAPDPRALYRVREHVSRNQRRFRSIVESPVFRRSFGPVTGERLTRAPKGFDPGDPAIEYLRLKQFLAATRRPASFATSSRFYPSLRRLFERLAPFVRFLNEPLASGPDARRMDPLAGNVTRRLRDPARTHRGSAPRSPSARLP